jgi:putative tryptophan/tyrosine transport system substrate-binding protein
MRRRDFIALLGGAATWPLAAQGQQAGKMYRVGVLNPGLDVTNPQSEALEQGLREEGFVEGRNLIFEHRFAEGNLERLPAMAAELVGMNVDVIVVRGPVPMQAAKAATAKIPIVMAAGSIDPVGEGLIASFARPGGNITGLTYSDSSERFAKELDVLREAVGPISRIAILWDLDAEYYRRSWSPAIDRAAGQLGLNILGPFRVRNAADFERAFAAMTEERAEAVLVSAGSVSFPNRARIGELGIRHRLPIVAAFKEFPEAGSLISYGPNIAAIYRRAAAFVGKILKGANPGELPVENPTTYDFVINLKTAKALGLTIPPALLIRADEVIE